MSIAIYPGTFDPVTYGHLDVLERGCRLFQEVIMVVANNRAKQPAFTMDERICFIEDGIREKSIPNAKVIGMQDALTVDFARQTGANAILRGLRVISDFEFEFQMAQMNRELDPGIETVFLMPSEKHFYTSSQLVKQVARYTDSRIEQLAPRRVLVELHKRLSQQG